VVDICLDTRYAGVFHVPSVTDSFHVNIHKIMFISLSNFIALSVCDSENVRVFDRSDIQQGWPRRAETCSKVE